MLAARRKRRSRTRNSAASACCSFSATTRQSALSFRSHTTTANSSAPARARVSALRTHAARRCATLQQRIALAVTQRVVQLPEVVKPHQQGGHHPVAALRKADRLAQPVQQAPVRQAGQGIVVGKEARRLLGAAQLGDIGDQLDAAAAVERAQRAP